MKIILKAIAVAAVSVGAAAAQTAPVSNPATPIANFDIQSIGPILTELGVTWQASTDDSGNPFIGANAAGEAIFYLRPTVCRSEGTADCIGLSLVAFYEGNTNPQTIQAFNNRYAFASAGIDPSGTAYLKRYEIADYGTPRGNFAVSVLNFVYQTKLLKAELSTARRTVALEGYAGDLAASALNRIGVNDLTGVEHHAANPVEQHQQGLEDTAAHILSLIADESAPRNKIENLRKN